MLHSFVALTMLLQMSGISTLIPSQLARAATECNSDSQGANDVPGQKDLTYLCVDDAPVDDKITASWQWDDLDWSGNNSGDACALFDTDGDGKANTALCVVINGSPASLTQFLTYTCGDASESRCTSPNTSSPSTLSDCDIDSNGIQPFAAGSASPLDTIAHCSIDLNEVGGVNAEIIDVCSYPSQQPNSAPSDCIFTRTTTPPAQLEIRKVLSPINDPGLFDLTLDGVAQVSGIGNGGTTGAMGLEYGTYTVGETASSGDLANYDRTTECKRNNTTIAGPVTNSTLDVTLTNNNRDIVCTITNTRKSGSVTLVKSVSNNNGGTLDVNSFGLSINGSPVTSGQTVTGLPAGSSVAINETGAPGYVFASISGDGCPAQLGGPVTVVAGQNITCTITNVDVAPQLTVIKHVATAFGSNEVASDFDITITGTDVSNPDFSGSETGTTVTLDAGAYSVSENESDFPGYTATYSADCSGTIALGEHKTCTITNTPIAPTLRINKLVINDNGGTLTADDFSIKIDTASVVFGAPQSTDGDLSTYTSAIQAVANYKYTISEADVAGYTEGVWSCLNQNEQTVASSNTTTVTVTLNEGDSVTCQIKNNDDPATITVKKEFINLWGTLGDAMNFTFNIDGQTVDLDTATYVNAGSHTVGESPLFGWTLDHVEGDCTMLGQEGVLTAVNGGEYTCILYNVDSPATLTIHKEVVSYAGTAPAASSFENNIHLIGDANITDADWTLDTPFSIRTDTNYTLSEDPLTGYESPVFECNDVTESPVALQIPFNAYPGQVIDCTVTNTTIAPKLTVNKYAVNNNSGTLEQLNDSAFQEYVTIDGHTESWTLGTQFDINTDVTYTIGEEDPSALGYTFDGVNCFDENQNYLGSSFQPEFGQVINCTVFNDDIAHPEVDIQKFGPATAREGEEVTYTFEVRNTGDVALSGVAVSDDIVGDAVLVSGDDNNNNILEVGEVWFYEATYTIPANQEDNIVNVATVCAIQYGATKLVDKEDSGYEEPCGTEQCMMEYEMQLSFTEELPVVCDQDDHELDVIHPEVQVTKSGPSLAYEGDTVTYSFLVENPSDVDLMITSLEDDIAGTGTYVSGDTNNDDILQPDEQWLYDATYTIPVPQSDNIVNTVTVFAVVAEDEMVLLSTRAMPELQLLEEEVLPVCDRESNPDQICDTDVHTLDVIHPEINVVKSGPATAAAGETVTYTFTITNPGDTPLTAPELHDSITGIPTYRSGDINDNDLLDPGETWVYDDTYTIPAGQTANVVNVITACAYDSLEEQVCDEDDHTLRIPILEVLSDTIGPELSKTGASTLLAMVMSSLSILTALLLITKQPKRTRDHK